MLNARSQQWSLLKSQPGSALGSGNCAVAAGRFIFLIGGFHRKSGSRGCSRRNEVDQDQVQIFDTTSGSWRPGPSLLTGRRSHGCTVVDVAGRFVRFLAKISFFLPSFVIQGIMVAGGSNLRNQFLTSVEYLDLGENLNQFQLSRLRWRNLPELKNIKSPSLGLVNSK